MPNEIVFRLTTRQRLASTLSLYPILLVQLVLEHWDLAAFLFVLYTLPLMWTFRFGATLASDGILLRGFRRRFVPWHRIRWIDTRGLLGGTAVQLHLMDGGKVRLRAPVTGFGMKDPDFWPKLATIQHWWRYYTGQLAVPPEYRAPQPEGL